MKRGSIMFCPKCGAQNPDGSPFCASCGAQLNAQQPQQPVNQGGFGQPMGTAGGNGLKLNPAEIINDFLAFFKNPVVTIQQIIIWAGCGLLLISTFLPNYKYSLLGYSVSFNLWSSRHAIYTILLLIFVLAAAFFSIAKQHICTIGAAGLIFFFWILDIATKEYYSAAIGLWIFFLSSLAICAGAVWAFIDAKKKG